MEVRQVKRKVLLIGDGAVGKTSLIRKFVTDKFDDKYITTIGTKVTKKDLRFKSGDSETVLTLMIWDILGQKGYTSIQASSYSGAEGAMIVCDLTRKETLSSTTEYWIPQLRKVAGQVPLIFVGNKCDLVEARQISEAELNGIAATHGAPAYVSSAKTGENVELIFQRFGELVLLGQAAAAQPAAGQEQRQAANLTDVTDMIISEFCALQGDHETAMATIRQQFSLAGVDVKNPTKAALMDAVERLARIESQYRGDFDVKSTLARRKRLIEKHG
jgi:small GTP-binding protein